MWGRYGGDIGESLREIQGRYGGDMVRVRVRDRLARSIVRQCAALPHTYVPPHSEASSVIRVSLESSGVPG